MPKKVRKKSAFTNKSAKKSAFTNKSAQKSTLKSTFGSSEPIWSTLLRLKNLELWPKIQIKSILKWPFLTLPLIYSISTHVSHFKMS